MDLFIIAAACSAPLISKFIFSRFFSNSGIAVMNFSIIEINSFFVKSFLSSTMEIFFEVPQEIENKYPNSLEMLFDFFNQNLKGSLSYILKEKGLILEMYAGPMSANNLKLKRFDFDLTEEGVKRKYEIYEILFAYLNKLSKEGLSKEILSYLTDLNVFSYEQSLENPHKITSILPGLLKDFDAETALDFKKRFGEVTTEKIKFITKNAISPLRMVGGYLGQEVHSEEISSVFNRPIKRIASEEIIRNLDSILLNGSPKHSLDTNIELPQIAPNFTKTVLAGKNDLEAKVLKPSDGVVLLLKENHSSPDGAMKVRLYLPPQTLKPMVFNELLFTSFKLHYSSELTYFSSLGLLKELELTHRGVEITLTGNRNAQTQTLTWLISKLATFVPSENETLYSKQILINKFNASNDNFSAQISYSTAFSLILNYRHHKTDILNLLNKISHADMAEYALTFLNRSDLLISAVGDYTKAYFNKLLDSLSSYLPKRLTRPQRIQMEDFSYKPSSDVTFWENLGENKAEDALGLTYLYKVDDVDIKEKIALEIFSAALGKRINHINREVKGLGYVHDASLFDNHKQLFIGLYGQADTKLNWLRMTLGWEEVISKIKSSKESVLNFEDQKTGIIRGMKLLPVTMLSEASEYFSNYLSYDDPNYRNQLEGVVNSLTDEDIYSIGREALLKASTPAITVIASKNKPCERVFTSLANAKKRLKSSF